jgi:DamX protein
MNYPLTSHANREQTSLPVRTAESALITLERCQKLDLLIHLISNLRQTLIICGPSGIGKTTLLDELKFQKNQVWPIYTLLATSILSFESIQDQLTRFLKQQYPAYKNEKLSSILSEQDKQNQKIVVIIDNAGLLVPGLIQALIQYAATTLCLRIIFSLTHDEIQLKNSTDRAIDDCHFIEIPLLTEKQCGIFLKNLSVRPGAKFTLKACNDQLIEKIYRETHGVPGKIVSELPRLTDDSLFNDYKWLSIAFIAIMTSIGINFLIPEEPKVKSEIAKINPPYIRALAKRKVDINKVPIEKNKSGLVSMPLEAETGDDVQNISVVEDNKKLVFEKDGRTQKHLKERGDFQEASQKISNVEKNFSAKGKKSLTQLEKNIKNSSELDEIETTTNSGKDSQIEQRIKESNTIQKAGSKDLSIEKLVKNKSTSIKKFIIPDKKVDQGTLVKNTAKSDKVIAKITQPEKNVDASTDNSMWILEQPEKFYTIQLMVLSKHKSVLEFLKNNLSLKENLKFFQINRQGQKKYVLIYGEFKNFSTASKKMNSLPVEYRKSWVRRFRTLQKEINNN